MYYRYVGFVSMYYPIRWVCEHVLPDTLGLVSMYLCTALYVGIIIRLLECVGHFKHVCIVSLPCVLGFCDKSGILSHLICWAL